MDDSENPIWDDLKEITEGFLMDNAEDKEGYGLKYNQYNPEVHMGCFFENISSLDELANALEVMKDHVEYLKERGWDLAEPIHEGMILTEWTGDGPPPPEDSAFDETGWDLDGNHIDDWD